MLCGLVGDGAIRVVGMAMAMEMELVTGMVAVTVAVTAMATVMEEEGGEPVEMARLIDILGEEWSAAGPVPAKKTIVKNVRTPVTDIPCGQLNH